MSQKEEIIERLKEKGCRITKQRKILIDIILENDCASCKEIGAISRKNMYRIESGESCGGEGGCEIILEDDTVFRMPKEKLDQIVRDGIRRRGYLRDGKKILRIVYHDG